ncbi:sigma-70 family RNA polymerase sigma factor [bacterium]|nr:sigma-70 family RNA polymerase sigma factor [bacterium]
MLGSAQIKDLIIKVQNGDLRAFDVLVSKYDQRIMALLIQMLGNQDDARDVYQDVFIRVWKSIGKFRFNSSFYTWLYRIAVNTALSFRKRRTHRHHYSLDELKDNREHAQWIPEDSNALPDRQLEGKEITENIEIIIHSLPLQQRVAFILRYYQEFRLKEIAEIMNCTEGTVKSYVFRATHQMRKKLKHTL